MILRNADPQPDASACAAIYGPYVSDSVVSFEERPPTAEEMADRSAACREEARIKLLPARTSWR